MKNACLCAFIVCCALSSYFPLKAQILTGTSVSVTDTNGPLDFEYRTNGILIAKGSYGTASLPDAGAGNRFFWYAAKGSLRAGTAVGTEWNDASIGTNSIALGNQVTASGANSVAIGNVSSATGSGSIALGNSISSGLVSTSMGGATTATSMGSVAMGIGSSSTSTASIAAGWNSISSNYASFAAGFCPTASGCFSSALGYYTISSSVASTAVGQGNVGGGDPVNWVPTDPLFEVGNGSTNGPFQSITNRSDALIVYKNGNASFPAAASTVTAATFVTTKASGDIPMYTGN